MPTKPKELYPEKNILKSTIRDIFIGDLPEIVDIPFLKGELTSYKKGVINKAIKTIVDSCKRFKIGVCGDLPIRIEDKKYRKNYDKVSVVYKCKKEDRAKDYEVELIKKFMKLYPNKIDNESIARAGKLVTYDQHYKIYIIYSSK